MLTENALKILVYSANYAPEPTGIGKYSGEMAAWLLNAGHEVRVIAAPPYYPAWQIAASHAGTFYSHEVIDGVPVWRAPLWVPRRPSGLTRVVHLLSFAASSLPVALRHAFWRPDVVFSVAPAFVCAPAAWLTARLCGATAWLHVQDFEVDVAFRMGLIKESPLRRAIGLIERAVFSRFDRVSTISNRMLERASTKGVPREKLVFFPNWVDVHHIRPGADAARYRAELGLRADEVVFLYAGSLGGKQGLQLLPAAAAKLAHRKNVAVVICGDGLLKEELQTACAGMENVRMLPLQPAERLGELLAMADVHLLTQSPGAEDLVLPSKLSGMLASGRPVIATCQPDTELAQLIDGRGLRVPPDDVEALVGAMATMADSAELRAELGARGRAYAEEHLAKDAVLGRMVSALAASLATEPMPHTATLPHSIEH